MGLLQVRKFSRLLILCALQRLWIPPKEWSAALDPEEHLLPLCYPRHRVWDWTGRGMRGWLQNPREQVWSLREQQSPWGVVAADTVGTLTIPFSPAHTGHSSPALSLSKGFLWPLHPAAQPLPWRARSEGEFTLTGSNFWVSQAVLVIKKKRKKNLPANAGDTRDTGSVPRSGRFPWRRAWQLTPVVLPGESHGLFNPCQTVLGIYIPQYHCWK